MSNLVGHSARTNGRQVVVQRHQRREEGDELRVEKKKSKETGVSAYLSMEECVRIQRQ
jgi:hypothetical protein